ncbi:MAG: alanine--glyoxylate aminotransferase family protein [Pseudomonadales bacterium]|nr:alanine--glyoxylate aminotransferase family protein [Gammaproteobacteria bacterium]NNL57767.1 alanine--glyoxylate aminotransferase family protein [Pseudomonadales bacterium]
MLESFMPPKRTLMGPGPSDVHPRILSAMGRPTIGHLDPEFIRMMDEVKELIQYAFQTRNELTFCVSAPGSAGMESCFVNLLEPGDTAIVCVNGVFGTRMLENVKRCGATAVRVDDAWGSPVAADKLEAALQANPDAKLVAFVHAETSTGVQSDAKALCALASQYNCLSIVDCVTSLGGIPVELDAWGADAAYSGSQKCLSCSPGLSPVSFSERAAQVVRERSAPVQSWFLDLNLLMGYWGEGAKRAYHHTAPINALYGLHEALLMLQQEGLQTSFARHAAMHQKLREGLNSMGIEFVVQEPYRLPQLNSVYIPDGADDAAVRKRLLDNHGLEIGAGLGDFAGKVWRIGLMGYSAREENIEHCLAALKASL